MKKNSIALSLLAVIIMFTSCEKLIEIDQPDLLEKDQAFGDNLSTNLSILGIYSLMSDLVEPMFLAGEVRADLVTANKSADPYIKEYSNNTFSSSNPYISPQPFYSVINNTNDFLEEFQNQLENQEMDTATFLKYSSELNAIRVWTQYQITRIYGKCKYYKKSSELNGPSGVPEYAFSDTNFLRMLINDLTYSDTINFTNPEGDAIEWQVVRMNDFYINELMGELLIDIGDYEEAIAKFNEVLFYGDKDNFAGSGRFRINEKFGYVSAWFEQLFYSDWETSDLVNNALFMIAFDNKYNQTNQLWNWTLSLDYQVAPSEWYIDEFERHYLTDDVENSVDGRILSIFGGYFDNFHGEYAITKYQEDDRPFILARTGRVYLLRMFCMNALGMTKNMEKEFEKIRERILFVSPDFDNMPKDEAWKSIQWVEELLVDEMAYEMGFEGQRWFDLMRFSKRRNNNPDFLANKVAEKYPAESRESMRQKLMDQENWFIPIFE